MSLTDAEPVTLSTDRPVAAAAALFPPSLESVPWQPPQPQERRCKLRTGTVGKPERCAVPENKIRLWFPWCSRLECGVVYHDGVIELACGWAAGHTVVPPHFNVSVHWYFRDKIALAFYINVKCLIEERERLHSISHPYKPAFLFLPLPHTTPLPSPPKTFTFSKQVSEPALPEKEYLCQGDDDHQPGHDRAPRRVGAQGNPDWDAPSLQQTLHTMAEHAPIIIHSENVGQIAFESFPDANCGNVV